MSARLANAARRIHMRDCKHLCCSRFAYAPWWLMAAIYGGSALVAGYVLLLISHLNGG